jgi:chromosome segregation ATPase
MANLTKSQSETARAQAVAESFKEVAEDLHSQKAAVEQSAEVLAAQAAKAAAEAQAALGGLGAAQFAQQASESRAIAAEKQLAELAAAVRAEAPTVRAEKEELALLRGRIPTLEADLAASRVIAEEQEAKMKGLTDALVKARREAEQFKDAAHQAQQECNGLNNTLGTQYAELSALRTRRVMPRLASICCRVSWPTSTPPGRCLVGLRTTATLPPA